MVQVVAGATSVLHEIEFTNPLTGAPLPALVAADVTAAYRVRGHAGGYTAITLSGAGTLGTYLSGGFLEVDAALAPGSYEVGLPNQFAGTGAQGDYVDFVFQGPNGAQTKLAVEIVAYNPQSATVAVGSLANGVITPASLAPWPENYTTKGTGSSYTADRILWDLHQRFYSFVTSGTAINIKGIDNTTTQHVLTMDDATNPDACSWTT